MEQLAIKERAERCRRLASMMTDDDVRQSLQELAREYEAQLPAEGGSFMLRRRG
jgi:hypothetical protein